MGSFVRFSPEPEFWSSVQLTIREALGPEGYDAAFAAGAALAIEEAVAYVRRARGERKRPARGWKRLTPTELEIVRHVAAGLTNRQIGQRMFITSGTVKTHLSQSSPNWALPRACAWPPKPPGASWIPAISPTRCGDIELR